MEEVAGRPALLCQAGFFDLDKRHQPLGDHFLEEGGLAAEVMAHRTGADARTLGHLRESGSLVAVAAKDQHSAIENLAATLVGASVPPGFVLDTLELLYCHTASFRRSHGEPSN